MKKWGRYVNPNTRQWKPAYRFDGRVLWQQQRYTSHWKKYDIDWRTWIIFIWLVSKTVRRHPQPFNKTERGKQRRDERKFRQQEKTKWLTNQGP